MQPVLRWILAASLCSGIVAVATGTEHAEPTGIDLAGMDRSIQPGDDFDAYANGGWRKTAMIPADRSSTGIFLDVYEKAERRNAELIKRVAADKAPADSNARKIADDYAAYMDETGIEQRGLAPLRQPLQQIAAIHSRDDLASALARQLLADVDPINGTHFDTEHLFGLFVTQGLEDHSHNIAYLLQGGLGMPNRDYYLESSKDMQAARSAYRAYLATQLTNAGIADAQRKTQAVFDLETKIAKAQLSLVDSEDVHKANNLWGPADFAAKAPGLAWSAFFRAAGLASQKQIDAWQPSAIAGLSALTASEPLDSWKAWLTFHTINASATVLPKAFADAHFDFYGRTLEGTPKQLDRWKRAVVAVNADLGDAVGQLYVQRYFPASSKTQVQQMVSNILAAFDDRVGQLHWMTATTREKARAKIKTLRVGVGYPGQWRDYADLDIRADDPVGNRWRAEPHEYHHQLAKLGRPVDKGEWWMTPQTVNAVNLPLQNALNFRQRSSKRRSSIRKQTPPAYGSIGAVIGHEISHSFDTTGTEFDAQGRLANWWTPADHAHFKAAGQKLVEQYDLYEVLPGRTYQWPANLGREHRRCLRAGDCLCGLPQSTRRQARTGHQRP